MRIALAGIEHETNTYCQGLTQLADFYVQRGERMFRTAGQESPVGGAIDGCTRLGIEAVPILHAMAQPSGVIERSTYDNLKKEILIELAAQAPLDGCLLLLHGAGVVEGIDDLEGDLAQAVRELLGAEMPIVATFDLHGNITAQMAQQLNGTFACRQYPHIDMHTRSGEALELLQRMAQSGLRSHTEIINVPMLMPTTTTFEGIGESFLQEVLQCEEQASVVDISWFHGFPYADVPQVGSTLCITRFDNEGNAPLQPLAESLWGQRERFRAKSLSAAEAVGEAAALIGAVKGPVVIHETSDNCGGGSPGDGTHLLRAMLEAKLGKSACFGFIVDAETAQQAAAAGVGAQIQVRLGGKTDDLHGEPIEASAYVKAISDGQLVMQYMFKGAPLKLGTVVRLVIEGMDVVVGSRRSQTFDSEPFACVGIDVMRYNYVALKSSNHFRAGFTHLAGAIITADPPGLTTHHIEVFPRQKTARSLWPIDNAATLEL